MQNFMELHFVLQVVSKVASIVKLVTSLLTNEFKLIQVTYSNMIGPVGDEGDRCLAGRSGRTIG